MAAQPNDVFNIAKGRVVYYATLPAAADSLIVVPLETAGLVADATLIDYDDLATLLAGASNEQTTMGRKTLTGIAITVDDTNERVDVDAADFVWTAATGNPISKLVICYKPDTASVDSAIIPLTYHAFVATPDGNDLNATIAVAGFFRAAGV